jgi:two-component system, chemotaxis family, chemotaxis protein CheY
MSIQKTILTVDDSATIRELLLASLTGMGFRVVQAADGMAALETLKHQKADIIITDVNMPRLDGLAFIEALRKDDANRATPVLVMTTETDQALKDRARKAGATGWIVKPFDPTKLADAIRRVTA